MAGEAVARDKILGAVVVGVEKAYDLISLTCDVGREKPPQAGEFGWVERTGSDLDGEDREGLDQRQARDEQLSPRSRR